MKEDNERVLLALDVGSSSIRCTATDANDADLVLARISRTRKAILPGHSGKISLSCDDDSGSCLLDMIDECVDDILEELEGCQIVAVGFSSFVMNFIGVDATGAIVGNDASMSYACQSSNISAEIKKIKSELGPETSRKLYQNTGTPFHSAYALGQLRVWYENSSQEMQDTVVKWQTIASACYCRWTRQTHMPISFSEASWTGLLNFRTCEYESGILDLLPENCREALPSLTDSSDFIRLCDIKTTRTDYSTWQQTQDEDPDCLLAAEYSSRWPALRRAHFFPGIGDGACANIGSKCSTERRIACTIGTSAAARICISLPRADLHSPKEEAPTDMFELQLGLFCYRIDKSNVLVGGALTDGGSVVEWVCELLNRPMASDDFGNCMTEAKHLLHHDYDSAEAPTMRLSILPFLSGERSTGFRSGATGAILGLTKDTGPAHFLKSSLEGVTLRVNAIVQLIVEVASQSKSSGKDAEDKIQIICSGKALEKNELWREMIADCTGLPVVLDDSTTEGTSRGVAILVSGYLDSKGQLVHEDVDCTHVSLPRKSSALYWKRTSQDQESFLQAVSPLYI